LSSGTYYVSQTLNSCESSRTAVIVTINPAPGAPTASAQTFCNAATVADLVATGTSLKWYTVATGGNVLVSTTALTTRTYYVSQTVNAIESSRTAVAVTLVITPSPSTSSQTFCNGATIDNLTATGNAIQWYTVGTGGTALASTTSLSTGVYYVSQTLNSCESPRIIIGVTIVTTVPPTSTSQTFDNTATVADLVATGGSLRWYTTAFGGTPLVSTTPLSSGTYYVSQTLNSCESLRTAVAVTINPALGAPTASAQTFCNTATVSNLVASGTSLQWYTVATGGTALASNATLTTGTYYVSQTINTIESTRTAVAVTVNVTSAPSASAQSFCNAATISNLVANGTSLKWYNVGAGGTVLSSTSALTTGTYYVTQTVNSCESPRIGVSVTINVTPAPIASSQSFCNAATISNLVATGTNLKWYNLISGGTAIVPSAGLVTGNFYVSQTLNSCESSRTQVAVTINTTPAPTASSQTFTNSATVANLLASGLDLKWYSVATGGSVLSSTTALTSGNYYVSQTINSCESSRTLVVVTVNSIPAAPIASPQTFCNTGTVANLIASGTLLKWYNFATGGSPLALTTILASGNYYVSQTVNSVESPRTMVVVTVNTTVAPSAFAQTFNTSATVANLVAVGSALKWYTSATGGTALASTTILTTRSYYVSQTLNSCESPRTLVSVTVNLAIANPAPTAFAQTFCSSARVRNLVATGTSLKWYRAATGGTSLSLNTVLTTGNYYVSQTINSIESSRTMVAVTIYGAPITRGITSPTSAGTSSSPLCTSTVKVLNIGSGYSATNIQWERAVVGLNTSTAPASSAYMPIDGANESSFTVTNAVSGKNYFRVKFTNGNCESTALYSNPTFVYYKDCSVISKLTAVSYPNPFVENFKLSLSAPTEDKIDIAVYDMMGKLIDHNQMELTNISELELGDAYPSGIYNVVVAQGDQIKTVRVVKR